MEEETIQQGDKTTQERSIRFFIRWMWLPLSCEMDACLSHPQLWLLLLVETVLLSLLCIGKEGRTGRRITMAYVATTARIRPSRIVESYVRRLLQPTVLPATKKQSADTEMNDCSLLCKLAITTASTRHCGTL